MPHRFALPFFLAAILCPLTSHAQAKRPMTIDDLITTVRVSDPQLSHDGKRVAFTRTTTVLESGRRNSDIWVTPSDGSAPTRLLIGGDRSESSARFTPDGKRIVFISNRDGTSQINVADLEGREPRQLTKISAGVQGPVVVSPDGKKVAFVSDVYPRAETKNVTGAPGKPRRRIR